MKELIAKNDYYQIEVDRTKNRSYAVYTGFWKSLSLVPNYIEDSKKAIKKLSSGFTSMVDLREMKTPPTEVAELFIKMQKISAEAGFSRGARVIDAAIIKIAAGRVTRESDAEEKVRMFGSWDEAEEWLDSLDE